jgi:hypothetical protein
MLISGIVGSRRVYLPHIASKALIYRDEIGVLVQSHVEKVWFCGVRKALYNNGFCIQTPLLIATPQNHKTDQVVPC